MGKTGRVSVLKELSNKSHIGNIVEMQGNLSFNTAFFLRV